MKHLTTFDEYAADLNVKIKERRPALDPSQASARDLAIELLWEFSRQLAASDAPEEALAKSKQVKK